MRVAHPDSIFLGGHTLDEIYECQCRAIHFEKMQPVMRPSFDLAFNRIYRLFLMRNDPYFVSKKLQFLIIFPKQEKINLETDKPMDVSHR